MPTFDAAACAALIDALTTIGARAAASDPATLRGKAAVRSKADGSPVTAADEAAEAVICDGLGAACSGVAGHFRGAGRARKADSRSRAAAIFWSIRSTARGNSSPAATNIPSISR